MAVPKQGTPIPYWVSKHPENQDVWNNIREPADSAFIIQRNGKTTAIIGDCQGARDSRTRRKATYLAQKQLIDPSTHEEPLKPLGPVALPRKK